MRTPKEVKEQIAAHLLAQGYKSKTTGVCQYHASNGTKCAVGCVIPAECYDPIIEGVGVAHVVDRLNDGYVLVARYARLLQVLKCSQLDISDPHMSKALIEGQEIHDSVDPILWPEKIAHWLRESDG